MKKIVLSSVAILLVLGIASGAYWWMSRPQVIIFSDDATMTLLKVDYGKRHAPPATGKPSGGTGGAAARANSFQTPNDALVLWVRMRYDTKQNHYFNFCLSDKAGTGCTQASPRNWRNTGNEVVAVQFDTLPRRQGKFYVRVEEQGNGQEMSDRKFVVSNPGRSKSYATWTGEPLPSTKQDDDVSVTLTKLVAGAQMPYQRN